MKKEDIPRKKGIPRKKDILINYLNDIYPYNHGLWSAWEHYVPNGFTPDGYVCPRCGQMMYEIKSDGPNPLDPDSKTLPSYQRCLHCRFAIEPMQYLNELIMKSKSVPYIIQMLREALGTNKGKVDLNHLIAEEKDVVPETIITGTAEATPLDEAYRCDICGKTTLCYDITYNYVVEPMGQLPSIVCQDCVYGGLLMSMDIKYGGAGVTIYPGGE